MKASIKLFLAAIFAALVFTGCQDEPVAPISTQKAHFILHAGTPATKTGIQYDAENRSYSPYWNAGDELGVLFNLPTSKKELTNDAVFANTKVEGTTADFEGEVELEDGEGITFYSYYPATAGKLCYADGTIGLDVPNAQSPVYNSTRGYSFDPAADLLIAEPASCEVVDGTAANEVDMFFTRLTGVLRIELNAAATAIFKDEAVKSIKFETSSGDIAGRVVVNPLTCEYTQTNAITGSKAITATYNDLNHPVIFSSAKNVFLCVAPVTIPAGSALTFTIKTVHATTGAEAHTLIKTIASTPKDIVFEGSKSTVIKLSLTDDNIQNNTIEYTLVKNAAITAYTCS